jgi:hypothetical protein
MMLVPMGTEINSGKRVMTSIFMADRMLEAMRSPRKQGGGFVWEKEKAGTRMVPAFLFVLRYRCWLQQGLFVRFDGLK